MMKRKHSFLMAALILLSCVVSPFGVMGQNTYQKVTSTPNDWSGEYLLVYESDSVTAYYWTGVDAASCYETATIEDGNIAANPTVTITIASLDNNGYSIKVNGGTNDGKYIYGQEGSNLIKFGDDPMLNTLEYDNSAGVVITSFTSVMRFNSSNNNLRFRYFKASTYAAQQPVQLYKKSSGGSTQETVATPYFNPGTGTYTEATEVSIECETEGATIHYTTDGTNPTVNSEVYSSPITISENTTVKAIATKQGMNNSGIATAVYTIVNPTPGQGTTYTLVTSIDSLVAGSKYIIVGIKDGAYKALGKQNTNNRASVDVSVIGSTVTLTPATTATDTEAFELTLGQDSIGYWTLFDAVNQGYLYAGSSSANYLKVQQSNDANGQWTIEITEDGVATIKAQGEYTRNWMRLNTSGNLFACYGSGQLDVYLYKAGDTSTPPAPTYYAINIAEGIANGSVTTNPAQQAAQGTTVIVTATPNNNYELATLTYSYAGISAPIDIMDSKQFQMPAAEVTVNATFTEQQSSTPITIAEAKALALNEYALVQGVVTFIDGRNVYIQDETAGIDLFLNSNTVPQALAIGDMVQAYGKRAVYRGLIELSDINGSNASQFSILSSGNELPLSEQPIAYILDDATQPNTLQSTRVKIVGATIGAINTSGNTPLTQEGSTINIYKVPALNNIQENDIVDVIAVIGYFDNPQLRVALASDVTVSQQQMETVAPPYFNPEGGMFTEAIEVAIECETEGASIYYTTDDSDPTPNSFLYESPITINETTTIKAIAVKEGMNDSEIVSTTFTIEISPTPQYSIEYNLVTSANDLIPGDKYIIVGIKGEAYKALGKQNPSNRAAVDVTVTEDVINTVPASSADDNAVFEFTLGQEEDLWTLHDDVNEGYLYAASSSANQLKVQTDNDANGQWTIEIDSVGVATIKAQGNNTRNWLRLNTNGALFSCYANNQLDVYLYKAGEAIVPLTPVATPTFTPTAGSYIAAQTVTIACATEGATIFYTTDGEAPTPNSSVYESPITVSENTTIKAMAVMEGMEDSGIATATYTIIQPITIAAARDLAANEYALVQGVVTFIDGRNVYVQDETAGIDLFLNNNTVPSNLAIGDMVLGYGKKTTYNGLVELSSINGSNANQFAIVSSGNELPLAVKTIAEILADFNGNNQLQSTRVQIVNATIGAINNNNNTPITQDENTMNIYRLPVVNGLMEGDFVTVTGVIGCFTNPQLRVNSADDVEYTHPPMLAVTPNTLSGFTYVVEQGPSEIQSFQLTSTNLASGRTYIYPSENFEISSFGGDAFVPERRISISSYSGTFSYPFYVRLKAGLDIGNYQESLTIVKADFDTLYVACSGSVTEQGIVPVAGEYIRLADLSTLTNGSKVIFAARFDGNANQYYAMTAQTSGKPEGVLFTSVTGDNETLPSSITDDEDTFYWTVVTDGTNYTFTNANGDMLGYTSSTNFSTGGDNVNWAIELMTSGESAMVPNYSGFVVTNVNNPLRGFALNSNHNFGPYHTQNMTSETYNFFIDMFATTEGGTPVCATPTFTPEGGTYYEVQSVTISCATADATIYYTLDGSDPTPNSLVYTDPIEVGETTTIKAIALKEGYNDSNIATAEYTIVLGVATIFYQDWEGEMNGWTFVSVVGEKPWTISEHNNNHYAYANGYNGGVNEQWCISPAFNLDNYSDVTLSFLNAKNYTGPDVQLFFSNNYNGEDPTAATWSELEFIKSTGSWAWVESGPIALEGFTGTNCYIGFKYTSTEDQAAAWEIDDIALVGFTSEPYLTATPNALTGFTHVVGEGPSASQTFVISGGNLPPAPGGEVGGVTITCDNTYYELSLDNLDYYPYLGIEVVGTLEPTTIYVRLNGEEVGTYQGTITIEDFANTTVSLSGTVTAPPVPGDDWNRIHSLADLSDGDQVIIASRYDATSGNGYYAMTAGVSGKPDGVLFSSVNNNGVETLPAEITAEADTYRWIVTRDGDVITLTNVDGDALGYSSSTNFAGNTSIEWTIAYETAGENAMVPNYTGFLITNAETTNRCIVMNANYKFGAYHTNNINSPDYNFYLDLFVQGGSTTPTVATPVFSMASGTYYEEIDVEITCSTDGATIYYTTDGSDPTTASSVYSEPIHVADDMTLKAFATKEGYDDSGIATANYVINTSLVIILDQDWEGEMDGWTFVTVEGNKPWTIGTYAGNKYANANGYNDDVDNEQWCISPAFNLDEYAGQNVTLTFRNATKFDGPALELYISNDYNGTNPTTASWQPLSYIASEGNYVWTESGEISLNGFSGAACYIGFKYISTVSKSAAAWEIDDILVTVDMSDDPYLTATPNALSGFQYIVDNGPSDAQTFVLSGGNLPPVPGGETGSVTLTVNHHFEISLDGVTYTNSSLTIPDVVGTLEPTTVYVRLNGLMLGHYEGTVTIEDYAEITVALSGDVVFDTDVNEVLADHVKVWNRDNEIMIENNSGSTLDMAVYNILSQAVMDKRITTGSMILSHHLTSGLYVVTLSNSQGSVSTKIVVR